MFRLAAFSVLWVLILACPGPTPEPDPPYADETHCEDIEWLRNRASIDPEGKNMNAKEWAHWQRIVKKDCP